MVFQWILFLSRCMNVNVNAVLWITNHFRRMIDMRIWLFLICTKYHHVPLMKSISVQRTHVCVCVPARAILVTHQKRMRMLQRVFSERDQCVRIVFLSFRWDFRSLAYWHRDDDALATTQIERKEKKNPRHFVRTQSRTRGRPKRALLVSPDTYHHLPRGVNPIYACESYVMPVNMLVYQLEWKRIHPWCTIDSSGFRK